MAESRGFCFIPWGGVRTRRGRATAPCPEPAERGGRGRGGAVHGELDGEGGPREERERRREAGWGGERDARGEEEDDEALPREQRRGGRHGRCRRGSGRAREVASETRREPAGDGRAGQQLVALARRVRVVSGLAWFVLAGTLGFGWCGGRLTTRLG